LAIEMAPFTRISYRGNTALVRARKTSSQFSALIPPLLTEK
jgi:hypothetical protein